MPLDNNLFSNAKCEQEHEVTKKPKGIKVVPARMTKEINGVVAMWMIGVKGSKAKDGDTNATVDNLDALIS